MATEAPGKPLCRPLPPAWVPRAQEAQETQQGGRIRGGRRGNTVPLAGMTSCHRPACTVSGDSTRAHAPPFVLFPAPGGEGFAERSSTEPQAPLFRNHRVPGGSIDLPRVSLSLKWSDPSPGLGFWGDHCWMGQNVHGPPLPPHYTWGKRPLLSAGCTANDAQAGATPSPSVTPKSVRRLSPWRGFQRDN